ncbi:MAG: argininosuccinate lyase [Candidatus Omnitrophica bacterium]|nr:argininosuccinate lyase [Candidatus Omnitrophota bacterium]
MSSKMWGGRFTKKTNPLVEEFTKSIQFDKKLARYDCIGSLYHINILKKANLLTGQEYGKLKSGLEEVIDSVENGSFEADLSFEDIHSYIQHLLEKKLGKVAHKLHTCRSRNDQVVFDTKLYCLRNISLTLNLFSNLSKKLTKLINDNKGLFIPGYTHMQHAMPVSLCLHLDAYVEMFTRDVKRLSNAFDAIEITMGSGALAGTIIDSEKYSSPKSGLCGSLCSPVNPIDTVSDRDFVIEILGALSITSMHLSRLAEDLILWSTKEFDFIDIDDAFCTGSSLMPQKKNPDVLELVRGNTGKLYGNLMSVLVMMKGLPLSYNRDMQLDKEPLFDSFEIIQKELKVLTELAPKIKFKKENIAKQLEDECLYATDMADYLVQKGVAFKDAHMIIGKLITSKLKTGKEIKKMKDSELKKFSPILTNKAMKKIIDPKASVASKKSVKKRSAK